MGAEDRFPYKVSISKDGNYFTFFSGYTEKYAEEKKLGWHQDDRVHFYTKEGNKQLWTYRTSGSPEISPDGSYVIVDYSAGEGGGYDILTYEGKKVFEYPSKKWWGDASYVFSPDSNYFAVVDEPRRPLTLFQRDGTKLWERGIHKRPASISEGAAYISTYPYRDAIHPENSHNGIVYNKAGNVVMEGFGFLSGNGSKIAILSSGKVSIMSLPDKVTTKEIPVQASFAVFSYDGRYLVLRNESTLIGFDLLEDIRKEITITELGKFPLILLTTDGKYLLILPEWESSKIYYYQLY
ncbi:MAG: hypothetical protein AB1610_03800 [Nitrospirota bacterium]